MVIALLVALGVNTAVVVAFAWLVLGRRRWLRRQPGNFSGAIRVVQGDFDGLDRSWTRGSARWVRDILVWNRVPFMFRNDLVPIDGIAGTRQAEAGEIKRIGDEPTVVVLKSGDTLVEVATAGKWERFATGPFSPGPRTGGPVE